MTDFHYFIRTDATDALGDGSADTVDDAFDKLSTAEAAIRGNTYSSGDTADIQRSVGAGSAADTSIAYFNTANWANPPDSVRLFNKAGEDHNATYDAADYRTEVSTSWAIIIRNTIPSPFRLICDDIQVSMTGANSTAIYCINGHLTVRDCILQGDDSSGQKGIYSGTTGEETHIIQNVIYKMALYGFHRSNYMGSGELIFYSNTIHGCGTGILVGSNDSSVVIRVYNNLINGCTTDYNIDGIDNSDNNISEDATGPDVDHDNTAITFADETGTPPDFQTSDSNATGLGTDLSADSYYAFSEDKLGVSRGTWDIGAFQDGGGGGGLSIPVAMRSYRQRRTM